MTWIIVRVLVFFAIGLVIFFGVRKIWRDWTNQFRSEDKADAKARLERNMAERARPDVITLERDKDGTFRPPDHDKQG